ncbi:MULTISPECIES: AAA family ATPase [unclassified Methylobacterium]|uniref:AAA family ATPase n=1 Tax=unclassified Methylobacterium TaxID=2615210 RepID=UPI0036FFEA51
MRLRRLDLTRYGKFTDFTLDFGERAVDGPDLHIVYGLNEAGKSTAFSGFLDLLFGIEERSTYGFLHQYAAMEIGAALEFGGKLHEVRRVKQRTGSLRDASGQTVGDGLLVGALGGLTRDAYRMMFSLDDQTLESGGNAILDSKGELGELLFSAGAGLAGLSKALTAVSVEADGIFRKRASSTAIAGLKKRLTELKTARDQIDIQANAYSVLVADFDRAERAYAEAMAEHVELKARSKELGGLVRAAPLLAEHRRLAEQLSDLGALPHPPGHWASELPALIDGDATLKTRLSGLDGQIRRLRDERDAIVVDEALVRLTDRISALTTGSARNVGAEADLPRRRTALAESRSRLVQFARSITGEDCDVDPDGLVVDAGTLGKLRELIERWSGVETRLASTATELEAATQAEKHAKEDREILERDQPTLDATRKAALQAAVAEVKGADLLPRRRLAATAASVKARAVEEAMRLVPWPGKQEDLEKVQVPLAREIQDWRDTQAGQDFRRKTHRQHRRDLETERAELQARIEAAETGAGAIGDDEAAALRKRRDAAWTAHRAGPDARSAAVFEGVMRAVDTMADARLAAADRLAELRGLKRDEGVCEARMVREGELLAEVDAEIGDLSARIEEVCASAISEEPFTSPGERIARFENWIARRDRAVSAVGDHRSALANLQVVEGEITDATASLDKVLRLVGAASEGLELAILLQAADDLLAREASQTQARAAADKLVRDSGRSVGTRRKAAESAVREVEAWRDEWASALAGTWFQDRSDDRHAVRSIVDALTGLPARLTERDELMRRVTSMEADQDSFLSDLEALLQDLGEEAGDEAPAVAAATLIERHRVAVDARAQRQRRADDLAEIEKEQAAVGDEIAIHDALKADLLTFFNVQDLKEVSACLIRCGMRDQLEGETSGLATRIMQETGLASIEVAQERLAAPDADEKAREHEECARRLEDLDERLKSLFAARSGAADKLAAIGGDDAVARIEAERRTVMLEIEDKAVRFLHLRTGAILAEQALQVYREKHRGSMMGRASDAFRIITRDGYSGLATRPEKDRETLIGLSGSGGSKLATDMSKGTRFQLYLSLRLAGYEEFTAARQPVPFVADDIMETFDEPRSKEVLALFGKLSEQGQFIYLTHHRHLCDLARKAVPQVVIHELPS